MNHVDLGDEPGPRVADTPADVAGRKPVKVVRIGSSQGQARYVPVDLQALAPTGQVAGQRLPIAEFDALDRGLAKVPLGQDIIREVVFGQAEFRQQRRGRGSADRAEEVRDVLPEKADRRGGPFELIQFEGQIVAVRRPGIKSRVDRSDRARGRRRIRIGDRDPRDDFGERGPADRLGVSGAHDQIWGELEARVETREVPLVNPLRTRATLGVLQPRSGESVSGDGDEPARGITAQVAVGLALVGRTDVVERSQPVVAGLLEPDAADQPEPVVEELDIAAHVGSGNGFLQALGRGYLTCVLRRLLRGA